jgi:hypothetical protein
MREKLSRPNYRLALRYLHTLNAVAIAVAPLVRVSVFSLLVLFACTQPSLAQDSINLDFTVAQADRSQPSPADPLPNKPTESQSHTEQTTLTPANDPSPKADKRTDRQHDTIALSFDLPDGQPTTAAIPAPTVPTAPRGAAQADLFAGGSNSLVARTVGHAEGTRSANGSKTRAYYGHADPGNGVWNLGSFSYQHAAQSPEEADEKQLRRLQAQAETIRQRAAAHRLNLSVEEELNALDLANQSPLAALDTPGYVEWLKQAHDRKLAGSEAVLWARTQSYWDVQHKRWDAPGLGNSEGHITHDQNRRLTAIARALDTYQQQQVARQQEADPKNNVANKPPQEQLADRIIFQDLSPPKPGIVAQATH